MSRFKPNFIKNTISMFIIVLTILIGLFILNNLSQKPTNKIMLGGTFNLTDQNGNTYSSEDTKKKKLIYFGYTYCPDVCPVDILKISNFIDKNENLLSDTDFIFVTVDPDRDTVEQIHNFLSNFNENIIGLTGNSKDVSSVLNKFRVYVKTNKKAQSSDIYLVDHSSLIFLMSKNDEYITHFSPKDFDQKINNYLN